MEALITCLIAGEYTLYDQETKKTFLAKARGTFRNQKISPKVGDIVTYEESSPHAIITNILPRSNDFIRPAIANIDQALIVTSIKEPDLNLYLLDKMIIQFEYQRITPILIFSKADLLTKEENEKINNIINYYQKIGYQTFITTTTNPNSIKQIIPYLASKITVITGQSGVGKSSFLNLLDENIDQTTNEISKALNRGKHTTRYTKLFPFAKGFIADCPGFGALALCDMDDVSIAQSFVEFFKLSNKCKYSGCLHQNEPNCMVKKALTNKEILPSRYENYLLFLKENKSKRKW